MQQNKVKMDYFCLIAMIMNERDFTGELLLVSQSERSQVKNKERVIEKFYTLITRALTPRKKRKATKPSQASREDRLETKRRQAEKKERRMSPGA